MALSIERGVDDGEAAQRLDGGRGDERHVGELDAVALLEAGLLALAEAGDARHVDFVDGVDVGAGAAALDHALGDDGAHVGHRHQVACAAAAAACGRGLTGARRASLLAGRLPGSGECLLW